MVAMAASVTAIYINSLWGRGAYFFEAIKTVGHAQSPSTVDAEERQRLRLPASGQGVAPDQRPAH